MDASINSSSNLNFEGKLISKTKIKFNRKKLAKVAEHYKKLSEDLPDLFINTYTVEKDCAEGILKTSQSLSFTTKKKATEYLYKLNGKKHLIMGNHDKGIMKDPDALSCFVSVSQMKMAEEGSTRTLAWGHE